MVATNSKKVEVQKGEKKKKLPPNEIRNILISKLPQLKANIMMLDDIEIERIFYESVENGNVQAGTNVPPSTTSTATTTLTLTKP